MSTSALGGQRVGRVISQLAKRGYRCARISASGQRRGKRREENGLPGDWIAFAPDDTTFPHLLGESGGVGKRLGVAFAELESDPLPPGFVAIVTRTVARKTYYYTDPDSRHSSLDECLESLAS